jgi:pentatricopeptide repeat protein
MDNLNVYIDNLKRSLNEKMFSPVFIRLANVYFLNKQYESCINVCKTGLLIYPDYLTPKVLILRSLLKLGHLDEAEKYFNEIESKIIHMPIHSKIKENLTRLKQEPNQERIFYNLAKSPKLQFDDNKEALLSLVDKPKLKTVKEDDPDPVSIEEKLSSEAFDKIAKKFDELNLSGRNLPTEKSRDNETEDKELFGRIKIVTETLADIYAQQGNFKEAFNAYNLLLRAGTHNKKRIESKLLELERVSFQSEDH